MADQSPDSLMRQCNELRRRLQRTEQTLNGLANIDIELQHEQDLAETVQTEQLFTEMQRDDLSLEMSPNQTVESEQSGQTTPLGSSYSREFNMLPSSTPKAPRQKAVFPRELQSGLDSDSTGLSVQQDILTLQKERWKLKQELSSVKEENGELIEENKRLSRFSDEHTEELGRVQEKLVVVRSEADHYRTRVAGLEDRLLSLRAETEVQDRGLRDAEDRCDEGEQQKAECRAALEQCQSDIIQCQTELTEERKARKMAESQRDKALHDVDELQHLFDEYQNRTKEKIDQLQETENSLRKSLMEANQEKDDFLEQLTSVNTQQHSLDEQFRAVQEQRTEERNFNSQLTYENKQLSIQLSRLSNKLDILEKQVQENVSIQKENAELRMQVSRQQNEVTEQQECLTLCRQEADEGREILAHLEKLLHEVQGGACLNDSGMVSFRLSSPNSSGQGRSKSLGGSGIASSAISRPKSALKTSPRRHSVSLSNWFVMFEHLRSEFMTAVQRNRDGEMKSQTLQSSIAQHERDRTRLSTELCELKRESSDREVICSSLESRLMQKEAQVNDLQRQLAEKGNDIRTSNRELRKKTTLVTSLEKQLDEKVLEFTSHVTKLKQLEDQAFHHTKDNSQLKSELVSTRCRLLEATKQRDSLRKFQQDQCQELQGSLDMLQEEVAKKSVSTEYLQKEVERLKSEIFMKDSDLQSINGAFKECKQELSKKSKQREQLLQKLEEQSLAATNQIAELERSLTGCKDQVKSCISQLQESKDKFDKDMTARIGQIKALDRHLKQTSVELEDKERDLSDLQRRYTEQQRRLQESTDKLTEHKIHQLELQEQVSRLEQRLLGEKTEWVEESHMFEKKLQQACMDLEQRTKNLKTVNKTLKDVQKDKEHLAEELQSMEDQLHKEQLRVEEKAYKLSQLESELRQTSTGMEQRQQTVSDLETELVKLTEETSHQRKTVQAKEDTIDKLRHELHQNQEDQKETRQLLQHSQFEVHAKEQLLDDMRDTLRSAQEDLSEKREEIDGLEEALQERQLELQQRAAQVKELDMTMKEHRTQVERRIQRLEEHLAKSNQQIQDKDSQLLDLTRKLHDIQLSGQEKAVQNQSQQLMVERLTAELQDKTRRADNLQLSLSSEQEWIEKEKKEKMGRQQELNNTREQLQQESRDCNQLRQSLREIQQSRDEVEGKLHDALNIVKSRDEDLQRVTKDLKLSQLNEVDIETGLTEQRDDLEHELVMMKEKHEEELCELQGLYTQSLNANEQRSMQLMEKTQEQCHREREHSEQVMETRREINSLKAEVSSRKSLLETANETLVIKDSEIARLQAKLSGFERASGMKATEAWNSSRDVSLLSRSNTASTAAVGQLSHSNSPHHRGRHADPQNSFTDAQRQSLTTGQHSEGTQTMQWNLRDRATLGANSGNFLSDAYNDTNPERAEFSYSRKDSVHGRMHKFDEPYRSGVASPRMNIDRGVGTMNDSGMDGMNSHRDVYSRQQRLFHTFEPDHLSRQGQQNEHSSQHVDQTHYPSHPRHTSERRRGDGGFDSGMNADMLDSDQYHDVYSRSSMLPPQTQHEIGYNSRHYDHPSNMTNNFADHERVSLEVPEQDIGPNSSGYTGSNVESSQLKSNESELISVSQQSDNPSQIDEFPNNHDDRTQFVNPPYDSMPPPENSVVPRNDYRNQQHLQQQQQDVNLDIQGLNGPPADNGSSRLPRPFLYPHHKRSVTLQGCESVKKTLHFDSDTSSIHSATPAFHSNSAPNTPIKVSNKLQISVAHINGNQRKFERKSQVVQKRQPAYRNKAEHQPSKQQQYSSCTIATKLAPQTATASTNQVPTKLLRKKVTSNYTSAQPAIPEGLENSIGMNSRLMAPDGRAAKRKSQDFMLRDMENTVTAMQTYRSPAEPLIEHEEEEEEEEFIEESDAETRVLTLQEELRVNQERQNDIDRQLQTLEQQLDGVDFSESGTFEVTESDGQMDAREYDDIQDDCGAINR